MNLLNRRNPMLEELLLYTSVRLANDGRKYASVRLLGGALLSTFDTLTDLYMVYVYSSTGETGFANATLSSLLVNLSFQACVVLLQHKGHSRRKKLNELLYVLTFTKPGVDAYRVVIGAEHEVGSIMDPKVRGCEERSDELEMRKDLSLIGCVSSSYLDIAATTIVIQFQLVNVNSHATRFARRRWK